MRRNAALITLIIMGIAGPATPALGTTTIFDSTMSLGPWDDYQVSLPSGSHYYQLGQHPYGLPGTCRSLLMSSSGSGLYMTAHIINDQPYAPGTQGAVTYLSYSFDVKVDSMFGDPYIQMGLMLLQNGIFYKSQPTTVSQFAFGYWHIVARALITDTGFARYPYASPNSFDPDGAPIDFGLYATISGTGGLLCSIDNFRVKVWTGQPPGTVVGDFDLDLNDWTEGEVLDWHGTGTYNLSSDFPGNPDYCRTIYMNTSSGGGGYMTYHIYDGGVYSPASQGPLDQIDINFETTIPSMNNLPNLRFGTSILQGSNVYIGTSQRDIAATTGWYALTFEALTPDSFSTFGGGPPQPDFSETGQPMTFGFTVTHVLVSGATSSTNRVDNFAVGLFGCACDCHGDPGGPCDGFTNILDVAQVVNAAFRNAPPMIDPNANCPYKTTDVNCSGDPEVLDVVKMVNVAFRNGNPATEFCNPCP